MIMEVSASKNSLANAVLQHGALSRALPAYHGYLRQVNGRLHAQLREGVLQLVDNGDKLVHGTHPRRHLGAPGFGGALALETVWRY